MTDERREAERLAEAYCDRERCSTVTRDDKGWHRMKAAFLAGRESMRVARLGNLHTIAKDWQEKFEAERERSAKLIMTLQHVRDEGYAEWYITVALQVYDEAGL